VIEDFRIAWAKGYGYADAGAAEPATAETLFQAASISKPVAAVAALRAWEAGLLALDDDVNALLTSWKIPANEWTGRRKVTPRALLSHTAGTTVHGFPGYRPGDALPSVTQILDGRAPANTPAVVVDMEPATRSRYSGGGYVVLQLLLADVLGRPFPALVEDRVLGPLGMTASTFEPPPAPGRRAARAHDFRGEGLDAPWHLHPELAAAGLWTTASDLARFAVAVQRAVRGDAGAILSQATAREMLTPVAGGEFGLGFAVSRLGESWYFGHGGANRGFRAELLAHRDSGYGAAIMTNGDNGALVIDEMFRRIAKAYRWDVGG
jgi:CubicO group peptidase (beta-lactamase class C family)